MQIATTTQTLFSDTGLTPSTTYSYSVTAFDTVGNVSTSSAPASATTPAAPVAPPVDDPDQTVTGGGIVPVSISDILITPYLSTATLSWRSNLLTRYELRWGRTATFELGVVQSNALRREHVTVLTDLEPGTLYNYELISVDQFNRRAVTQVGQFTTTAPDDVRAPTKVSDLTVTREGRQRVDVAKPERPRFCPRPDRTESAWLSIYPNDGFIVYEGNSVSVTWEHSSPTF